MQNLWILNHYAVTPDMSGSTRHYDFAKELVKRGYEVTIFTSSFHYSQHKELKLTKNERCRVENIEGVNFVWIKTFPYQKNDWRRIVNIVSFTSQVYWLCRKITKITKSIKKPDIIIGSSPHPLAALSAYWLSKYYKAKFLVEIRDLWPQTLIDMKKFKEGNPMIIILRLLEKFLYQKAEKIITLLPLVENYIVSFGVNKKKIAYIPNGVNILNFRIVNQEKIEKYDNNFKVMYLGAHGIANVLEVILDAACIIQEKGYKNIKFIFIGDGTEKKNLISYANKLRLKNVEFRDFIKKQKIYYVLNEADLLLFNLRKLEVFKYGISSNKLFDYMMAGKPIIFSVNSGNNPVKEAGCGIFIPPENPEMMSEAIIKLYKISPEEREKMGKRGRAYVERYHSISVLTDKLEKVIKEVIHG